MLASSRVFLFVYYYVVLALHLTYSYKNKAKTSILGFRIIIKILLLLLLLEYCVVSLKITGMPQLRAVANPGVTSVVVRFYLGSINKLLFIHSYYC